MAAKKCGYWSGHKWARKTKVVSPGTYQKTCTKCGRVRNVRCGTFFNSHQFKRSRKQLRCKKCGTKKEVTRK